MVLNSYAKINLTLKVNFRGSNNLHEIQSYFCLINLADEIKIKRIKNKKDKISFNGPFAKFVNKSNNSINKLLKLLRELELISNYYSVTIKKNIPVFGGLGGGTSNAAFILRHLLRKKIKENLINNLANIIGSDFKLFFRKQGFVKNLKTIVEMKKKHKFYFVLIKPKIKCSTREIYTKVKKFTRKKPFNKTLLRNRFKFLQYLCDSKNDLQFIVEKKYPIMKGILKNIKNEKGCHFSRMTGSGSVCYGLFNNKLQAKKALNNLRIKYPKFWLSIAKTV